MYKMYGEGQKSEMDSLFSSPLLSASENWNRTENAVETALQNGDVAFMQRIVKLGLVLHQPTDYIQECNKMKFIMQMLFWEYDDIHSMSEAYFEKTLRTFDPLSKSRLFLVMRGLEALMNIHAVQDRPEEAQNYVLCLSLAFETIAGPVISSEEVRNYLGKLLPKEAVGAISKEYEQAFRESEAPSTPRSLLHLSRCSIRQNLRESGNLPEGIKSLPLPEKVKNYLRIV